MAVSAPPGAHPAAEAMRPIRALLRESQWWPAERLRAWQFRHLARLLAHAAATVPFYRGRLDAALAGPLEAEAWSRIPVLSRREVQAAGATLEAERLPPGHGRTAEIRTSGSTGMPVRVTVTGLQQAWFRALTLRQQVWCRRDLSGTFAAIRKYKGEEARPPEGDVVPRWAGPAIFPFPTGPLKRLSIAAPVAQQLAWLERADPDYLLTYPSNLAELARAAREAGVRPARLRHVTTIGELLPAETRALVRAAWDVPVLDAYSANEVGHIALQCPDHEHYHLQGEMALVEILDAAGRPCAPGEIGRVVVTPLHNYAMPLIRYEIGDYAEPGPPCPCGRGLPVLTRIQGRVRNMLIGPDGQRYWPSFGTSRFRSLAPIRRHQFVQKSIGLIEARLAVERPLTAEEEAALRAHIGARLPAPFEIAFRYVEDIPPSAAGKLENFICEIAA